ncbi:MAG: bifunctional demethylmenaquinone methyltransferase/2-methoxy-6-polyprenyl-1,4-benzoquinol methylase UbiE [Burkholderiaceae bacterium]
MNQTHFGFKQVPEQDKARHVRRVFDSVARRYDVMNDVMSLGLHRIWKALTVAQAQVREGHDVLDVASGTGDLALAFAKRVGPSGRVVMTDINAQMLHQGRDRMINAGYPVPAVVCDAEHLPFADQSFDRVSVAFGLRNMTHKDQALAEMRRVLRPRGKLLILEFSEVIAPLRPLYDQYSFRILPWLGEKIAKDAQSYQYLAESIRMHPGPEALKDLMHSAGFDVVRFERFSGGVVALHQGVRLG